MAGISFAKRTTSNDRARCRGSQRQYVLEGLWLPDPKAVTAARGGQSWSRSERGGGPSCQYKTDSVYRSNRLAAATARYILPSMNRLLAVLAVGLLIIAPSAFAAQPLRQIRGCMIQRMTADRLISYNDAKKVCLEQLTSQSAAMASSSAPKRAEQVIRTRDTVGTAN
jgi:hypothetical protein